MKKWCISRKCFICRLKNPKFWIVSVMAFLALIAMPFVNRTLANPSFPMGTFSVHSGLESRFIFPDWVWYLVIGLCAGFLILVWIRCCEKGIGCREAKVKKRKQNSIPVRLDPWDKELSRQQTKTAVPCRGHDRGLKMETLSKGSKKEG